MQCQACQMSVGRDDALSTLEHRSISYTRLESEQSDYETDTPDMAAVGSLAAGLSLLTWNLRQPLVNMNSSGAIESLALYLLVPLTWLINRKFYRKNRYAINFLARVVCVYLITANNHAVVFRPLKTTPHHTHHENENNQTLGWITFLVSLPGISGALNVIWSSIIWHLPYILQLPMSVLHAQQLAAHTTASVCSVDALHSVNSLGYRFKQLAGLFNWPFAMISPPALIELERTTTESIACTAVLTWMTIAFGAIIPSILYLRIYGSYSRNYNDEHDAYSQQEEEMQQSTAKTKITAQAYAINAGVAELLAENGLAVAMFCVQASWLLIMMGVLRESEVATAGSLIQQQQLVLACSAPSVSEIR